MILTAQDPGVVPERMLRGGEQIPRLAAQFGAERIAHTRDLLATLLRHFDADESIRNRRIRPPG